MEEILNLLWTEDHQTKLHCIWIETNSGEGNKTSNLNEPMFQCVPIFFIKRFQEMLGIIMD